jgi:hypothetical protein
MHKLFNANKAKLGHRLNLDSPNLDLGTCIAFFYIGHFVIGGRVYIKIINLFRNSKMDSQNWDVTNFWNTKTLSKHICFENEILVSCSLH